MSARRRWARTDALAQQSRAGVADQDATCPNGTIGCPGPHADVGELPCFDCLAQGGRDDG